MAVGRQDHMHRDQMAGAGAAGREVCRCLHADFRDEASESAEPGAFPDNTVVVTDRRLAEPRTLPEQLERVCALGPCMVVLREKDLGANEYMRLAKEAAIVCARFGVPLAVHTHEKAAIAVEATALHLTMDALRSRVDRGLRAGFRIGASVHSVEEAMEAQALGADYLIAGHIFPTDCKPGVKPRGLDFLREVCSAVDIDVFAIGGIDLNPERIVAARAAGASGTCTMSAAMRL